MSDPELCAVVGTAPTAAMFLAVLDELGVPHRRFGDLGDQGARCLPVGGAASRGRAGGVESAALELPDGDHVFTADSATVTVRVGPRDQRYREMVDRGSRDSTILPGATRVSRRRPPSPSAAE